MTPILQGGILQNYQRDWKECAGMKNCPVIFDPIFITYIYANEGTVVSRGRLKIESEG